VIVNERNYRINWRRQPKGDKRVVLGKLAVSALVCLSVILPWTIRNYVVFHRVVFLKTSFGLNLWMGNNPNATGFLYTTAGEPMQNTLSVSKIEYLGTLNEAERYAVLEREAWKWIISHPYQFLCLTVKRIGYLWIISPTYLTTDQNIVEPRYFYVARAAIQALLLGSALVGSVWAYQRNRLFLAMSMWWLIAFTVPYAVSVAGNTRYRLPVEPILIIMASSCFDVIEQARNWQRRLLSHLPRSLDSC